jgi:hypothetical protein
LGGSFGVDWILLQQFEALNNKGHTFSNGDKQITNHAYNLSHTWATPKWCKWGSAISHTTWWREMALVGDGKGQSCKGTETI